MFGYLNLHKPAGCTSRDVVNHVQRLARPEKAGHAGTLDPLATGVLVVAIGGATRLIDYVQQQSKTYRGTFLLGRSSDTEDIGGKVELLSEPLIPTREQLLETLPTFRGEIQQVPPAYSALKVSGHRAYALARRGEEVKLEPRTIEIHNLQLLRYEYPEFELEISCSSGTYVRSLGRDIARAMKTEAVMSALQRTSIGSFVLGDSYAPEEITRGNIVQFLEPASAAVRHLPKLALDHGEVTEFLHGRPLLARTKATPSEQDSSEFAAFDPAGELVAIAAWRDGKLWPTRVFVSQ